MKSFIIERPATHHVVIFETFFNLEHPLKCDLSDCAIMTTLQTAWEDKPAKNGRYQVELLGDIIMLGEELPHTRYRVKPLR